MEKYICKICGKDHSDPKEIELELIKKKLEELEEYMRQEKERYEKLNS